LALIILAILGAAVAVPARSSRAQGATDDLAAAAAVARIAARGGMIARHEISSSYAAGGVVS
jgi:hypothetical protein